MIHGVKDVYYNVSDMSSAVKFYTEVLGMFVSYSDPYWTSLRFSGIEIGLHWAGGGSVPDIPFDAHGAHCGATLTLATDDIDDDTQMLIKNDVNIVGEFDESWGRITVFRDPDGNILKLMQVPT